MATQYTAGLTTGQVLTAATMNQIGAVWETWTPAVTQTAAVTSTTNFARYARIQKIVVAMFSVTITGAGTAGQSLGISFPITPNNSTILHGAGLLFDASTNTMYNGCFYSPTTLGAWFVGDWAANGVWGTTPNLAVANGDAFRGFYVYEAA